MNTDSMYEKCGRKFIVHVTKDMVLMIPVTNKPSTEQDPPVDGLFANRNHSRWFTLEEVQLLKLKYVKNGFEQVVKDSLSIDYLKHNPATDDFSEEAMDEHGFDVEDMMQRVENKIDILMLRSAANA